MGLEEKNDIYLEDEVRILMSRARETEKKVDELLLDGSPEAQKKICDILMDDSAALLFKGSKKLMCARIFSDVVLKHLEKGKTQTVFSSRNLTELEALYQELVFRLRRIEFDLDIDIEKDIFMFLTEQKIGIDELVAVLYGTLYLYGRDKIWSRITEEIA